MARPKSTAPPSYRFHRPTGLAVVTINGKDHYLGEHSTPESLAHYDRLIAAWLAGGRTLPEATKPKATLATPTGITIVELVNKYRVWSLAEYGDSRVGEHRNTMDALAPLMRLFGRLEVQRFGPVALREVRQVMIDGQHRLPEKGRPKPKPLSKTTVNQWVHRIRRVFRWAVSRELIPASVVQALQTVDPLRSGRGSAPDKKYVPPVGEDVVNATLPHLPWPVGDMVRLQLLTGMRSGELCILRAADMDTTGKVWVYKPAKHKGQRRGRDRTVYLGPSAQEIVKPYLSTDLSAYLFSPRKARMERYKRLRSARKSPVQPSQRSRKKREAERLPGERYTPNSYAYAIRRACENHGIEHWHPHQLRHTSATKLRREYGVDVARVILGHSGLDATAIYAEADRSKAIEVMAKLG